MPFGAGYIGIGKEVTFGTAVAVAAYLPVLSADSNTENAIHYSESIRNSRAKAQGVVTARKHTAEMELDAEPNNLGHFLLAALGSVTTTQPNAAGAPTVYEHVFVGANVLPSYTIERYDTVMINRYAGSKMDSLTLSMESGDDGVLVASTSWMCQTMNSTEAAAVPSYTDKPPFVFSNSTVEKGGVVNENIRQIELEITNNLKDDHFTIRKSRDVKEINEGMREVTVSLEMFFKDKADYTKFIDGEHDSLKITLDGGTISGGMVEKLVIEIPNINTDSFEVPMDGPDDEIMASIEGTALYSSANGYEIKVTLTNSVATY